jgi:hypothetical protein
MNLTQSRTTQGMATPLDLASEAALHSGPIRGSSVSSFCAFCAFSRLFSLPFVLSFAIPICVHSRSLFASIRGPFLRLFRLYQNWNLTGPCSEPLEIIASNCL